MASIYNILSFIAFSLSGALLVLSAFFWFKFNIPKIIGALSGHTARKSIEQMRLSNEKNRSNGYMTPIVKKHDRLTNGAEPSIKSNRIMAAKKTVGVPGTEENVTSLLNYGESGETELLNVGTTLLTSPPAQSVFSQDFASFRMLQDIVLTHTDEVIR